MKPAYIRELTDFIFVQDEPQAADIIFVPGNGHAAPSERAAQLYAEGLSPYVLPSGRYAIGLRKFAGQISGARRYGEGFATEWQFMRAVLMANGVPESAILREDEATYTYQNAINSRKRTDAEGLVIRRAIICCMPVHARRARMYYQTLYPETQFFVCPAEVAAITRENWQETEAGIDALLCEVERCGGQFHAILREILL